MTALFLHMRTRILGETGPEVEKVLDPRNLVPRKILTSQKIFRAYTNICLIVFPKNRKSDIQWIRSNSLPFIVDQSSQLDQKCHISPLNN